MSSFPSALTIMESLAGYAQYIGKAENPSANAPIRLAVIDPAYVHYTYPGTLPKVTFEGEETLSEKRYPVMGRAYKPGAGDRVVMLPVGHTYVIIGVITPAEVPPIFHQPATQTGTVNTTSTSFVSLSGGPTATIDLRAGQYARIVVSCQFLVASGVTGAIMSFRSTGASGTTEAVDIDGHETGHSTEWTPMERTTIWGPASAGGSHSFEARYRVIGGLQGDFKNRRIIAYALNE